MSRFFLLKLGRIGLLAAAASVLSVQADAPSAVPPAEWTLTPDGSHFIQRSTRLMWPRCVEGMHWRGGYCVGEPLWLDHAQAQALAHQRAQADGQPWRLPNTKELQQLARLAAQPPAKGRPGIPESTQGWVWSGTVPIQVREVNAYRYDNVMKGVNGQNVTQMKFLHGWVVNTATGESRDDVLKRTRMFVRLVRSAD